MKHQHDKKEAELQYFNQAKEKMEIYLHGNYKNIKEINFSGSYSINPMGGISVEGYLNGNKAKEFYGIYDKSNDEIVFPQWMRKKNQNERRKNENIINIIHIRRFRRYTSMACV